MFVEEHFDFGEQSRLRLLVVTRDLFGRMRLHFLLGANDYHAVDYRTLSDSYCIDTISRMYVTPEVASTCIVSCEA